MAQVTVGAQVLPITPNNSEALYVTNMGPNQLWYSRDPSVTPTSGQPLDPGNAVQGWPVGLPMYVVAPNGSTTVAYESNGSSVAIGATTATLDGPVGVTGTVSTQGRADALAISTATTVVNLSGVTLYDSRSGPLSNLGSMYQTLVMAFNNFGGSSGVDTLTGVQLVISQFTASGLLIKIESPAFFSSGQMRYTTSCVGAYITVQVFGTTGTIRGFSIAGLSAVLPHSYWQTPGNSNLTVNLSASGGSPGCLNKVETLVGTLGPTTGTWFPDTYAGPGTMEAQTNASTNGMDYSLTDGNSGTVFWRTVPLTLLNAAGSTRNSAVPIVFPESPVQVTILNRDTVARSFEVGFTFQ